MKITSTDNNISIIDDFNNTTVHPKNTLRYSVSKEKDGVTIIGAENFYISSLLINTTVNGSQMTADNIDELLNALFFFEIEIEDVNGLSEALESLENSIEAEKERAEGEEKRIEDKFDGALENKADLINGYVPSYQLPSYVDDVIEGELVSDTEFDVEGFIIVPERGKIYVDITTNKTYRWSGSIYTEISKGIMLGETSDTAFRGDHGLASYKHSQLTSGNPHKVTKSEVGLSNVDNTSDVNKPVSTAQATAIKKAVDDIQIGGVNVLRNTNFESSARQRKFIFPSLEWFNAHLGQSVALSCYIKTDDVILSGSKKIILEFALVHEDGTSTYMSLSKTIADNTTFEGRISRIQNLPTKKTTEIKYDGVYILDSITSGTAVVGYPQMELGNKATDWSISTADILSISENLKNLEIGGRNFFYDKVWKSYWTRIEPTSGTNSVENNLLKLVSGTGTAGFITSINQFITEKDLIENNNCIISFEMKAESDDLDFSMYLNANEGIRNIKSTQTWKRYYFSFKYKYSSDLKLSINNLTSGGKIYYVRNIKLEEGNKITGWSIAPEDIQAQLTALSNRLTSMGG